MKKVILLITACLAIVARAQTVDVLYDIASATWTGGPTNWMASFSYNAQSTSWYSGLGLSSAWSINEGSGTNVTDYIAATNGWFIGGPTWSTRGGLTALVFDGNDAVFFGDVYDLRTNGMMLAAWVWLDAGATVSDVVGILGKPYYGGKAGRYALYASGADQIAINANYQSLNGTPLATGNNAMTGKWGFVSCVYERSGRSTVYTNGVFCSAGTASDTGASLDTADYFTMGVYDGGSRYLKGSIRHACLSYNGTSNQMAQVWERTRAEYGK